MQEHLAKYVSKYQIFFGRLKNCRWEQFKNKQIVLKKASLFYGYMEQGGEESKFHINLACSGFLVIHS
jgi:hypothetical protein